MSILDLPLVAAFLAPRHRALGLELEPWVASDIATLPAPHDDAGARHLARTMLDRLGAAGWLCHALPVHHGGTTDGPDLRALCLIREILAAASPLADAVFALQALGSMPLTLGASHFAKATWLTRIATGDAMAGFAMTEVEAGSDVSRLRTTATPEGDGYRLDGEKTFISNAGIADLYVVFAMLYPERGNRGIAAFAVAANQPGLVFARAQTLAAPHPLGVLRFEACWVPATSRIDADATSPDAAGFKLGMMTLDRLRPTVAAAACGMAARALDLAIDHARVRVQFGKPLAELQLVQAKLATMATELAAARLLTYSAAATADGGAPRITLPAAMAKSYATEAAQRIVDQAVQIVGGRALVDDHPLDHLYRAVRALRIYEGATEIQQLVIARELLATR